MRELPGLAHPVLNTALASGLQESPHATPQPAIAPSPLPSGGIDVRWAEHLDQVRAAQRLRQTYASTVNDADATVARKLYTCVGCAADTNLTS